jgi:hypothetical protein
LIPFENEDIYSMMESLGLIHIVLGSLNIACCEKLSGPFNGYRSIQQFSNSLIVISTTIPKLQLFTPK